jgi:hypothetical protein
MIGQRLWILLFTSNCFGVFTIVIDSWNYSTWVFDTITKT